MRGGSLTEVIRSDVFGPSCLTNTTFAVRIRDEMRASHRARPSAWTTIDFDAMTGDERLSSWLSGHELKLPGGEPWAIPADPDWSEDPFLNVSWQTGYHSLMWLGTLAELHRRGEEEVGTELVHYVVDWATDNPMRHSPSRPWFDGSVWRRTMSILAVWDVILVSASPAELAVILKSLHQHGDRLLEYLSDDRFVGHNHNIFHALALYDLAEQLPEFQQAGRWRSAARARLTTLLPELVNPADGASTEQASLYHGVDLRLYAAAERALRASGDGLDDGSLALLRRATTFGALLPDPQGALPAIGDTYFGASADSLVSGVEQLSQLGVASPEADYILSRGADGRRPADAEFFTGEGYGIFRPSYGETTDWESDLHVVVDMGPDRRVHGHHDAMNVLLAAYGRQLLVDSGGPYQYGVPERDDFVSATAHNTVVVDGLDYGEGDVDVTAAHDARRYSLIAGQHDKSPGAHHSRVVLLLKPSILLIVDELTSTDGRQHRYELMYHVHPRSTIAAVPNGARIVVGRAGLGLAVAASTATTLDVRQGEIDPLLGWVTRANRQRSPAPVLAYEQTEADAWYVTAIATSPARRAEPPTLSVSRDGPEFVIDVSWRSQRWEVKLGNDDQPQVRRVSAAARRGGRLG